MNHLAFDKAQYNRQRKDKHSFNTGTDPKLSAIGDFDHTLAPMGHPPFSPILRSHTAETSQRYHLGS